ncbi:methyltransferase, FxLD system [Streptomyces sp. NPDC004284]|uniref:methyltransferase, FxLD system n=1 Tax=Streptomyces sp. NPDC004284 TaxID=3364695 RepID=UPI0036A3B6FA
MYVVRSEWEEHYADGRGFRLLGDDERELLARRVPAPGGGGRALDAGCGKGDLALFLASAGYQVDAVDFADSALTRAREEHGGVPGLRWLALDLEQDDWAELGEEGYDLIAMRLVVPFLKDRARILHALGERLRPGGKLLIITPTVGSVPVEKRGIALDEEEIALIASGWERCTREDLDGLAVLTLQGPCHSATRAVEHRLPPAGPAMTAACAVVTDAAGRVLLGSSRRGHLELPGGKTERSESFEAAAVRELLEETGLVARVEDAHVVAMLADDGRGVPRLSAVVRVTAWSGKLSDPEPERFAGWQWYDLHALSCLGEVFAPSAQALEAVWPGTIPGLPPVHRYPVASEQPPVAGEPAEAVRRRTRMAQRVIDGGWAPSASVQEALRTVPRHRFAPEVSLETAYDDDLAVVTRRDRTGRATSSVSAAWLQADMIEGLDLAPGACVWEAGSGGYNAELLAHVAGPGGRIVTSDIDRTVVHRARRLLAEAGSGRVTVVHGDAARGLPSGLVPRDGFDAIVITYRCRDIAPVWRDLLADGGRLVLPLDIRGYTRSITFQRDGNVLNARKFTHCGFVAAQGEHAHTTPVVDLLDGELRLCFEDGPARPVDGLEEALRGPRSETATAVTMGPDVSFGSLQLYAATTLPGFCRLAVPAGCETSVATIAAGSDVPALADGGSLAYLTHVRTRQSEVREERRWEWFVHAFGDQGDALADRLVSTVRAWDQNVRSDGGPTEDPALSVHPADAPDRLLPAGDVVSTPHGRIVVQWPGRDALLPALGGQKAVRPAAGEGA